MSCRSILASCLAAVPIALAAAFVDDSECDCYVSDGSKPTYFASHGFWDFRSLSQYAGVPDVIQTKQGNVDAPVTSDFFAEGSEFSEFWGLQNWQEEGAIPYGNSYNNLYIQENEDGDSDTFLTMRTARLANYQTCAEFESIGFHQFASMRMYARTVGSSGACTSMFTYHEPDEAAGKLVQEADIEMLTQEEPNVIHYTNQPTIDSDENEIPESNDVVTLASGWDEWTTHRQDWTPGLTLWYANGKETNTNDFQVPEDASQFIFNAWSDGNEWTGLMDEGGETYQQIQWIEILYGEADGDSCQRVCSVDKSGEPGKVVRV